MRRLFLLFVLIAISSFANAQLIQSDYVSFIKGIGSAYAPHLGFSTTVESDGRNKEISLVVCCSDTYAKFDDGCKLLIKLIDDNGNDTIISLVKNSRPVSQDYSCHSSSYGLSETYQTISSYDCDDLEYIVNHLITKVRYEISNTQQAGSPNYREREIDKKYQKKFMEQLKNAYTNMWLDFEKAKNVKKDFSDGF